jgi:hypothetical protein
MLIVTGANPDPQLRQERNTRAHRLDKASVGRLEMMSIGLPNAFVASAVSAILMRIPSGHM